MGKGIGLRELLSQDNAPAVEKTAAEEKKSVPQTAKDAINNALASFTQQQKVAAANPTNDLNKLASEVISNDRLGEIKHASLIGRTMADGFFQRVEELNKAAELAQEEFHKTAMEQITPADIQLIKMAKENPEAFLQQVYQGAMARKEAEEKTAYEQSYRQTVELIHTKTAEHFIYGYSVVDELLKSA